MNILMKFILINKKELFMSRHAKANVTIKELKEKITSLGGPYNIVYDCDKVGKDLSKIDVDFENTDYIGEFDMPGTENLEKFEMLGDNTGDNISKLNKHFCELTTQYWAWKNVDCEYYGFCHYNKYFAFNPG